MMLTEVPLSGEPTTDRAFRCGDGRVFRARVLVEDDAAPRDEGAVTVWRAACALAITIVELDDTLAPKRDAAGQVPIIAAERLTIDRDALAAAAPLDALVRARIAALIAAARPILDAPAAIGAFIDQWTGADRPADPGDTQ